MATDKPTVIPGDFVLSEEANIGGPVYPIPEGISVTIAEGTATATAAPATTVSADPIIQEVDGVTVVRDDIADLEPGVMGAGGIGDPLKELDIEAGLEKLLAEAEESGSEQAAAHIKSMLAEAKSCKTLELLMDERYRKEVHQFIFHNKIRGDIKRRAIRKMGRSQKYAFMPLTSIDRIYDEEPQLRHFVAAFYVFLAKNTILEYSLFQPELVRRLRDRERWNLIEPMQKVVEFYK